jgi:hypothetical protein
MLMTIIVILIILALLGSAGPIRDRHGCGYYPSGGLGLIIVILIICVLL